MKCNTKGSYRLKYSYAARFCAGHRHSFGHHMFIVIGE